MESMAHEKRMESMALRTQASFLRLSNGLAEATISLGLLIIALATYTAVVYKIWQRPDFLQKTLNVILASSLALVVGMVCFRFFS